MLTGKKWTWNCYSKSLQVCMGKMPVSVSWWKTFSDHLAAWLPLKNVRAQRIFSCSSQNCSGARHMWKKQKFKNTQPLWHSLLKSRGEKSLGHVCCTVGTGDRDIGGDGTGKRGVFGTAERVELATNYVSCCSCMVRAARVVLMLFSEMCCLSMSSWRWCYRYPKVSATPWEVSRDNNIWGAEFLEGWV